MTQMTAEDLQDICDLLNQRGLTVDAGVRGERIGWRPAHWFYANPGEVVAVVDGENIVITIKGPFVKCDS